MTIVKELSKYKLKPTYEHTVLYEKGKENHALGAGCLVLKSIIFSS
jgi:hypothetical protein